MPRQHRHLRAALDLEDAERVGAADHRVGARILGRDGGEVERDALVLGQEIQARFMQVSMPSASTSTFMKRSASMSSLSHSMTWRSSIAAGSIGTSSSSRSWVRTKPPGCWLRWRGAPRELAPPVRASRRSRRSPRLRFSSAAWSSRRRPPRPAPDLGGRARESGLRAARAPCRRRAWRPWRDSGSRSSTARRGRGRRSGRSTG